MEPAPRSSPPTLSTSKERIIILLLSIVATAHVVIFSSAFPFFILDEVYHFDLVVKYSHLAVPQKQDYAAEESMPYVAVFSTWEYMRTNDASATPLWKLPAPQMTPVVLSREQGMRFINRESTQPPLYYFLEGAVWRLANAMGFHDLLLLYLLRFFNALIVVAVVWLGWFAARLVFPGETFIAIAVPALIAFLPETAFYSIGDDALSPLCFGAAFVGVLCWIRTDFPGILLSAAAGLALAAAFLTKITNLPLIAVALVVLLLKIFLRSKSPRSSSHFASILVLFGCAFLPMAFWAAWCKIHFGDFTGSSGIAKPLGWTIKPFAQWWHHPIFTPSGFCIFLSGNLATFWQDEKLWHGQRLSLVSANWVYILASIVFLTLAAFQLKKTDSAQRRALLFAFASVAAAFALFGFSSIIYDFHDCVYPSRAFPYFVSGRLMLGMLVPFLLLFTFGLDSALKKFGLIGKMIVLALFLLFMLGSEIATDWPIFHSQYNWFNA
jgi:Predicted membrane protein (DUF2142)